MRDSRLAHYRPAHLPLEFEVRARIGLAHNCFVPVVRFRLRRITTTGSRTSKQNGSEVRWGIEPPQ